MLVAYFVLTIWSTLLSISGCSIVTIIRSIRTVFSPTRISLDCSQDREVHGQKGRPENNLKVKKFSLKSSTLYLVFDYLLHDLCVTWNRLNLCQAHPLCFILRVLKALKKSYLGTCGAITRDAAAASNENRADKLTLEFRSFWGLF